MSAGAFYSSGTDKVTFAAKGTIGHAIRIIAKVGQLLTDDLAARATEAFGALNRLLDEAWQPIIFKTVPPSAKECLSSNRLWFQSLAEGVQMFAGMVEVHDLHGGAGIRVVSRQSTIESEKWVREMKK